MPNLLLGPLLGHVTEKTALVWAQTDAPALGAEAICCEVFSDSGATNPIPGSPFRLETTEASANTGTCQLSLPSANCRYYYRLTHNGRPLHDEPYTFLTMPDDRPDRLVFSVTSCHQPFKHKGQLSTVLWRALFAELIREQARFCLMVGDQVYADEDGRAWQECLKVNNAEPDCFERRTGLYRALYRKYWDLPDVRRVMANFPSYMIWDDHEITNGWGSSESHREITEQNIFEAAQKVYRDFQHAHNPQNDADPSALYYGFHSGGCAFLTMDLRGHRQIWNGQLLGDEQKAWIKDFIASRCQDALVLFVISSVPLFHLDTKWAWIPYPDVTDQWSNEHNKKDRRWLLDSLFDWMKADRRRKVVVLGGDVHVGTFARATLLDDSGNATDLEIIQATSSPISNKPASRLDTILRRVSARFTTETSTGQKVAVDIRPRYATRNFLMVTVDFKSDPEKPEVRFEMHWEGKKNPDPYPGSQGRSRFTTLFRRGRI